MLTKNYVTATFVLIFLITLYLPLAAQPLWLDRGEGNAIAFEFLKPNFKQALYKIGGIYKEQNEYHKALDEFKKVLKIDPNDLVAQFQIGLIYVKGGKVAEGLNKLELVTKADPGSPLAKAAAKEIKKIGGDKFKGIPPVHQENKKRR